MAHKWWHVWGNQQQNNGLLNADPASIAGQAQTYMGTGLQNRMPGFNPLLNNTEKIINKKNSTKQNCNIVPSI